MSERMQATRVRRRDEVSKTYERIAVDLFAVRGFRNVTVADTAVLEYWRAGGTRIELDALFTSDHDGLVGRRDRPAVRRRA